MRSRIWFTLSLFAAGTILGQPLQRGDVLVSTYVCTEQSPFPVACQTSDAKILIYGSDGVFKRTLIEDTGNADQTIYGDTIVDGNAIVWAEFGNVGVIAVRTINSAGTMLASFDIQQIYSPGRLAPTASGQLLVAAERAVVVLNANGAVLRTIDLSPHVINGLDLAADQCTLYYTGSGIVRQDICGNQSLGTLTSLGGHSIRLLPDGSLLAGAVAASGPGVLHLTATGQVIRGYAQVWRDVALDVDGTSFWGDSNHLLYKIDIASGQVLAGPVDVGADIVAIGIVGEPRAATSRAAVAAIPAVSPGVLVLLACVLAAIAWIRLFR